ncbi:peptidylprolyl isomerase [Gracilimonas mengyeensis]|uniref:Parvulin-like peptidyl-prolyl isomerase n=1 Tax=Gracilimonas mengyeensis TaxID=1302730 RepID=A0A521DXS2_9BACT|nr:peptidylprolyl isomerase [Gracilimonas mengyeensis]SMO75690.1 Parvulin-like peptidyl-prolyl isomerase [Gracilimonas mengyeensis]
MDTGYKSYFLFLIVLPVVLLFASCDTQPKEDDEEVLARIENLEVTKDHFVSAFKKYYYKTGQAIQPSQNVKTSVLDAEFNPYVLATYAKELGLDSDREGLRQYGIIQRKVFAEEYLEREVLQKVEVTEEDIRELYLRFNTKIKASHLYAPDEAGANELYQRLQNGESFDKLAAETFQNPYLARNGGDLGEFTIDEMDLAFENAAFGLEEGEISEPVKTKQGYSIIKVTDRFTTPIVTEFQYASRKDQFAIFAERRKKEMATRNHLEEVLAELNVNETLINDLWKDIQQNQGGVVELSPEQNQLRLQTNEAEDAIIAKVDDYQFTVADLKKEGFYSPQENLNRLDRDYRFRNYVKGLIYRDFVTKQFGQMAASESNAVQSSIQQTFLNYLSNRIDEVLREEIELSDTELREEFQQNKPMYDFPLRMNLARIVVESEKRGEEAMQALENGQSWEEVLRSYSIDTRDIMVDGEMGMQPIQELGTHALHVKDLEEGEVAGPFAYQTGKLMIYKVLEVKEPREAAFEEVSDLVGRVLLQKKVKQRKEELIEEVKDRYNAVLNYDKLRALNIKL